MHFIIEFKLPHGAGKYAISEQKALVISSAPAIQKSVKLWLPFVPSFSLLRRGLFVLWGGWGERKRERAGHDRKGEERREAAVSLFPSFPARFLFLSIIDILMGIPSGSLCGGESPSFLF